MSDCGDRIALFFIWLRRDKIYLFFIWLEDTTKPDRQGPGGARQHGHRVEAVVSQPVWPPGQRAPTQPPTRALSPKFDLKEIFSIEISYSLSLNQTWWHIRSETSLTLENKAHVDA